MMPAPVFNADAKLNDDTGLKQLIDFALGSNWLVHEYNGDEQTTLKVLWDTAGADVVLGEAQFGAKVQSFDYLVWTSRTITLMPGLKMGEALIYLAQELVNACNYKSFKELRNSAKDTQTGVYVIEIERVEYRAFRARVDIATHLDVLTQGTRGAFTWQFYNTRAGLTQPAKSWNEYMNQLDPLHLAAIRKQHRDLIGLERDKFEGLLIEYKPGEIHILVETHGRKDTGRIREFYSAMNHLEIDQRLSALNLPAKVVVEVSRKLDEQLYQDSNNPGQIVKKAGYIVTVTPKV
jgi:hypothetical protein